MGNSTSVLGDLCVSVRSNVDDSPRLGLPSVSVAEIDPPAGRRGREPIPFCRQNEELWVFGAVNKYINLFINIPCFNTKKNQL